nr:hypothetical protein Iba_chr03aCG4610 [Ipomoea batatas]
MAQPRTELCILPEKALASHTISNGEQNISAFKSFNHLSVFSFPFFPFSACFASFQISIQDTPISKYLHYHHLPILQNKSRQNRLLRQSSADSNPSPEFCSYSISPAITKKFNVKRQEPLGVIPQIPYHPVFHASSSPPSPNHPYFLIHNLFQTKMQSEVDFTVVLACRLTTLYIGAVRGDSKRKAFAFVLGSWLLLSSTMVVTRKAGSLPKEDLRNTLSRGNAQAPSGESMQPSQQRAEPRAITQLASQLALPVGQPLTHEEERARMTVTVAEAVGRLLEALGQNPVADVVPDRVDPATKARGQSTGRGQPRHGVQKSGLPCRPEPSRTQADRQGSHNRQ